MQIGPVKLVLRKESKKREKAFGREIGLEQTRIDSLHFCTGTGEKEKGPVFVHFKFFFGCLLKAQNFLKSPTL